MSYLPTTIIRCLLILAIVISAVAAADAEDVAFGYIDKDGKISRIMYYRNGSWETAFLSDSDYLTGIQQSIVEKWVDVNNGEYLGIDCKNETDKINYDYICKLPKPLEQISAKELSAYLVTLQPGKSPYSAAGIAKVLTPDRLTRRIGWRKFQKQNEGENKIDLKTYAKLFWNSNASAFSKWYRIGMPSSAAIRAVHAYKNDGDRGDCGTGAGEAIKADIDGIKNHSPGLVATQKSGFVWNNFEEIATFYFKKLESVEGQKGFKDIPAQFMPAITKIKARWTESEVAILPKLKMETVHYEKTKMSLRETPFDRLTIHRAVSSDKKVSLVYFSAMKFFHSPFLPTSDNDSFLENSRGLLVIHYRGWAMLYPDGRIECPSANVDVENSLDTNVDFYTSVFPDALVELDGRQYVIAESSITIDEKGGDNRTEIFELADGKFKSRGIYQGSCGGDD